MNVLWNSVSEQYKAKDILEKIYQSRRVPHAFLFSGKEGVGKYFTALQFAKILNQQNDPARSRIISRKIDSLQEPYVKFIIPLPRGKGESSEDTATEKLSKEVLENVFEEVEKKIKNPYHNIYINDANTIKINSIREIKKFVNTNYDEIRYRFVILINAHLMNEQAQNALLKNLEEPPEGIIFILITSDQEKLLSTIKSRCWQINFEPLSRLAVRDILVNYFKIEIQLAEKISLFSDGSPLKAYEFIESELNKTLERTISILRYSLAKKYHLAHKEISSFLVDSNDKSIKLLVKLIKTWLTDILKNKHFHNEYYFDDFKETLLKFNQRYDQKNVFKLYTTLENLEYYQEKNLNLNVVFLNLIFDIASISIRN